MFGRFDEKFLKIFFSQFFFQIVFSSHSSLIFFHLFSRFYYIRQHFENEDMEQVKFGKLLPPPQINLCFENGKVGFWNGK